MKLSVIIVNYNVKHYLYQCLDSVYKAIEGIDAEVFVVDNHSHDDSVEYVQHKFKTVNYIESNHNLGFARANNIAIRQSEGEYVLLLNPDTVVAENTIRHTLEFMDQHPDAGSAGVMMLRDDGTKAPESRRGIPTPTTAFYKMTGLCQRYPNSRRFARYYMSYLPWDEPAEIEIVSGAYCMLRRQALDKVGLLDDDFFMYGEDIDLSYRLLLAEYHNWYLPETILHYKGESTQKSSFRYVHVFYEAMLIFFRKHFGGTSFFISLPIKMAIFVKATLALVHIKMSELRKSLGFSSRHRKREPEYLFIGSTAAIAQCKKLARRKGLTAQFQVGSPQTLPEGHYPLVADLDTKTMRYVVYDTETFSYQDILTLMAKHPEANVHVGTYNPRSKTLITAEEVMK